MDQTVLPTAPLSQQSPRGQPAQGVYRPDTFSGESTLGATSAVLFNTTPVERDPGTDSSTYIGRAHWEGQQPIDEDSARSYTAHRQTGLLDAELKTLDVWNAFELPPRAVHQSLIEAFLDYCHPWMPALEDAEMRQWSAQGGSLLLLQSVFLAASRVLPTAGLLGSATTADFYHRARALYWVAHEKDPLVVIKAITMLHWYNPDGPAFVSYDTSEHWLKIGACLAFQIGLHKEPPPGPRRHIRRRVWWSLVARDTMISFSRGRPRAIRLEDSDVSLPTLNDFPDHPDIGELFAAYVGICCIMGQIVELKSKGQLFGTKADDIDNALFRWCRSLPNSLCLGERQPRSTNIDLRPHNFRARQIHVIYFVCVAILARSQASTKEIPCTAVLASSFIAGIYEDFLARDLVRFLAPTFTSFAFVAALTALSLRSHTNLWTSILPDLRALQSSLEELSRRWKSAIGASKAVHKALESAQGGVTARHCVLRRMSAREESHFDGYPPALCRLHEAISGGQGIGHEIGLSGDESMPTLQSATVFEGSSDVAHDTTSDFFGLGDDWLSAMDGTINYFWNDWDFGR